ncbi:MAG: sugar phosphate nucleotidyltransferase [Chitinophagales bacterium]|nr:sugar phosphate nucleotidyltransferase [Chitinophagales bacterium]MDW8419139.1 sugar phosphate nucleotidyltransferase [Chitinophagales bacterium]
MQAIIPVAGAGTRLRPLTYTQPKALISVAGKPILSFIIDELAENSIKHFVLVIGYLGDKIKEFTEEHYPSLNITYVYQENRLGLGHAIWCARNAIDPDKEIIIHLGDTIVDIEIKKILSEAHSTLCVKKVEDPRAFGVAEIDKEGFITGVVEKPQIPRSNMALVGFYFIRETRKLFGALDHIIQNELHTNNEYYFTDALQKMISDGVRFKASKIESWYDVGKKDILLETNSLLLRKTAQAATNLGQCENTIVIPPVNIATGTQIRNSIIGPDVSIGENTNIQCSIIRNSIIGSYSKLEHVVLHSSLIGSDSIITGLSQSLNIGDNTEIDLRGETK